MKKTLNVVDMFCGAGGESTGIMQAALEQNMNVNLLAINHWELALETHAANHPTAEHLCESVERIDPTKVVRGRKLDLLWASPECTHHSIARGGRPRSDQSRASSWLILKWLQELYVERVIIENVPEFLSWGPLDRNGRPIQSQKGKTFQAFILSLQSLGYKVEWKILCAADYGAPTTRRRLFVQAVKGRKRIMWPEITHMDGSADDLSGYQPWIPARDIIDWSIPGTSIFDRKKPLADATIRRIAAGIEKYWGDYAKPFLAYLYGTGTVKTLDRPLPAISCINHYALVEPVPMLLGQQSGAAARPVDSPAPTVATAGAIGLIRPFITRYQGDHAGHSGENRNHEIEKPLPTVDTSNRYAKEVPPIGCFGDIVCEPGGKTNVPHRVKLHSTNGIAWGYGGSGPADFALNALAVYIGSEEAKKYHQDFKWQFVATMPPEGGIIKREDVLRWIDEKRKGGNV